MRIWLVLLATLPLLAVGSVGATAGTSDPPPRNGLIAARGGDGIYLIDSLRKKEWKLPGTVELGEPAWSPDGSLLAVEGWDEDGSTVYTIRPDGSDRQLVLQNAWAPSWSPDGKRLVVVRDGCLAPYTCDADVESAGILVTVRADGSDAQQVTVDRGGDSDGADNPVWSPDGKWIAFIGADGGVNLVSPRGEDDGVRRITESGGDTGWNLAWSPDASKLAFDTADKAKGYKQEITVFELATERRTILPSSKPISALAWSPDGKQLAFLSSRPMPKSSGGCGGEMPMDLWAMNADGSNPHRISKGSYGQPAWGTYQPEPTPSSQQQPKPSSQPQPKPSVQPQPKPSAGSGAVAPSATPTPTNATKSPRTVARVATAATPRALRSELIAARGRDAIYLIDPDRGDVSKIPGTAKLTQPAWSPDGSLLAVEQAGVGGVSVYTIKPTGADPRLVLRNASSPSWSPDGKRLIVARNVCVAQDACEPGDDGSTVFMTVRPDGSDARAFDFENEVAYDAREPAFPSDGNWIAFYADEGSNPPLFDSSAAAWSPDAKQLAFVSSSSSGAEGTNSGLWVVAADGGRPRLLATGIYGRPSWRDVPAGATPSD